MPQDADRTEALDQIFRVRDAKNRSLVSLRDLAAARRAAGDEDGANRLVLAAVAITRENLRIEAARRRALRQTSLGPALAALRALADKAERLEQSIRNLATALAAASRIVDLLRRLAGVLP